MTTFDTTPGWPTRTLRVAIAMGLVCVVGWYSPWVTASIWHAFRPMGQVDYRGLRIRVPWPWTADTDAEAADAAVSPQGLAMKKMPATMDRRLPPESIFITVISPDPGVTAEEQTERWMDDFRASHPGAKFSAVTPVAVPDGASCLSADNPARRGGRPGSNDVIWTCISMSGGWVANFEGHARDEPVFFRIVEDLKRQG